nr:diguanylate cyclase [uncultured Agathobaculum sp.]
MNYGEGVANKWRNDPVYTAVAHFFDCYLTRRDAAATLAMLPDDFCSVGTGEGEIAVGKAAFAELLRTELEQLPDPIGFTIEDYYQKERGENCWHILCSMEMSIDMPDGGQVRYHARVTAGLHRTGTRFWLDTVHASEASKYQQEGEFFPLQYVSRSDEQLSRENRYELLELIGKAMPGGIVGGYHEPGFPLYLANDRLVEMMGYQSLEDYEAGIRGMVLNCVHPEDRGFVFDEIAAAVARNEQYELDCRLKKRDGSDLWVHGIGRKTVTAEGREVVISVLFDMSRQVDAQTSLKLEAVSDPLTGVYNRKGAQARIIEAMQHVSCYLFFMLDLDNFKRINDLYGHQQGDEALRFVAEQLSKRFRSTDMVCRLGGDEFAVFVADCKQLLVIQQKLLHMSDAYCRMMQQRWPEAGSTMSAGGVFGRKHRSFDELYRIADEVLYEIKKGRKGHFKLRVLD